jgi:hypothetical protein
MTHDLVDPADWQHAAAIFPTTESERDPLLVHVEGFPWFADILRQANASLLLTASFDRTFAGAWGIGLVISPHDPAFAVEIYGSHISLSPEISLRADAEKLDKASIAFLRVFSERLGRSLSKGVAH